MKQSREQLSVSEASRALGVSERRVRAMVRDGVLDGRRIGGRWLLRSADVERRARERPRPGRPMSRRNIWSLLRVLSGEKWPAVPAWQRSRLRRKLGRRSLLAFVDDFRGRGDLAHFRADPRVLDRLSIDDAFVRSGVSAASDFGVDVRAPGVVEGYVPRDHLDGLAYRYALRPVDAASANVIVRAVDAGVFPPAQHVAPAAAVALDLIESADPRSRRAGRELAHRSR